MVRQELRQAAVGQRVFEQPLDRGKRAGGHVGPRVEALDDVVREGARVLKPGGRFYMVHRPFRLVEIFQTMTKYKLEPKRMKLVYPMADREPNMVLIEGIRGAKSMIKIEKPLIVYEKPGIYTSEIYDIYGY